MTEMLFDTFEVEKQTYQKNMRSLKLTAASRIDYDIHREKALSLSTPMIVGSTCAPEGSLGGSREFQTGLLCCSLSSMGEIWALPPH